MASSSIAMRDAVQGDDFLCTNHCVERIVHYNAMDPAGLPSNESPECIDTYFTSIKNSLGPRIIEYRLNKNLVMRGSRLFYVSKLAVDVFW